MVDVHTLSALLRQLDFKVVSLLDLRKSEMQMAVNEFLLLLDKGVYGAAAPAGAAPAKGGNRVVLRWRGLGGWPGKKRALAGQGMSPTLRPSRQVCSTMPGTAMKILATASWCPSTRPAPTPQPTACACSVCCRACSSAAPASTSSCSTCAARGDPALATSLGTSCHTGRSRHRGARGCRFPGAWSGASPGSHPNPLALSGCPKASLPPAEPANVMMGGQRGMGQPPRSGVPWGGF